MNTMDERTDTKYRKASLDITYVKKFAKIIAKMQRHSASMVVTQPNYASTMRILCKKIADFLIPIFRRFLIQYLYLTSSVSIYK